MNYRRLGKTNLMVSEIGLGAEWLERHTKEECESVIRRAEAHGINILDCWMPGPSIRSNIGDAIRGTREKWIIQGHVGSTWQNGQYVRTRSLPESKIAFQDLLNRLHTSYIDIGMMNYVDEVSDWNTIVNDGFLDYMRSLKASGVIRHIGMSTHNPVIAKLAVESDAVEMLLFSINPAFDILPHNADMMDYFKNDFSEDFGGISPERAELYRLCEEKDVGITVMKGYAGGRLFDAKFSPFQTALTPVQCLHYCLTRPAVASVMVGYDTPEHVDEACAYESAGMEEKDYASVLANAPRHSFHGQCTYCGHCAPCPAEIDIAMVNKLYDLAVMQPSLPDSLRDHYRSLSVPASACIGCKGCEERCPFGVQVSGRMEKAAALFE
ncbi:MAG: aldo/keto reductase [Clostridia bacterium]|nr:aldo/keto reductase [Clostridia bacterium]